MPLKLAGLLVTSGTVPSNLIDDALRRQVLAGGTFDTALLECAPQLAEGKLLDAIERASGLPTVDGEQLLAVDRRTTQLLPGKLADRHCLLPLRQEGRTLLMAVTYPANLQMLEEIGFLLGRELVPHVSLEARLREAISRVYGVPLPARQAALIALLGPAEPPATDAPAQTPDGPAAPTVSQAAPAPATSKAEPAPTAPAEAPAAQETRAPLPPLDASTQAPEPAAVADAPEPLQGSPEQTHADGTQGVSTEPREAEATPAPGVAETAASEHADSPVAEESGEHGEQPRAPLGGMAVAAATARAPDLAEPAASEHADAPVAEASGEHGEQPTEPPAGVAVAAAAEPVSEMQSQPPAPAAGESLSFDDVKTAAPAAADEPPIAEREFERGPELQLGSNEGLTAALTRMLDDAEKNPELLRPRPRRAAPRDRVDVSGLAQRIVAVSGGTPALDAQPAKDWTLGIAKAEIVEAQDRHQLISTALHFALKTFDFAAAFAVVGGNAVGWSAVSAAGKCDERMERISLPLDAPSVLRTVLMTRGRFLGPIPDDPISQSLLEALGRPNPTVALLYPVEVRDRPVVILYADTVGRPASDKRVAEFAAFAQHLGTQFERLIVEQKRRLAQQQSEAVIPPTSAAANREPALANLTTAELFARSPSRSRPREPSGAPALPSLAVAPAPGVSRIAAARSGLVVSQLPAMNDLFGAADRLVGTDLAERARALGELCRFPEVGAAVLVARFPGPVLRARVPVTDLPAPEELGPVPAALAKMGIPAARALVPLVDHRDLDTRYFALLTAGRLPAAPLIAPVAARVFDRHPVLASAARAALAAMRGASGWDEAIASVRAGLASRESDTAMAAARALGQLREVSAVDKLISLTGSPHKRLAQVAADALRDICMQPFGPHPIRWNAWWSQHREQRRAEWLIEALGHRDFDTRKAAIDELVRTVSDSFGFRPDAPRQEREQAIRRWERWWQAEGRSQPLSL